MSARTNEFTTFDRRASKGLACLIAVTCCAIAFSRAASATEYPSDWVWGTEEQGWPGFSAIACEDTHTTVVFLQHYTLLALAMHWDCDPTLQPMLNDIGKLGPNSYYKEENKEIFLGLNKAMNELAKGREPNFGFAPSVEDLYRMFAEIRLLKMYELLGFRVVSSFTRNEMKEAHSTYYITEQCAFFVLSRP